MQKKVYISVGHGGKDPGAVGKDANGKPLRESKINLNVSLKLAELLRSLGFLVLLSRETDDKFLTPNQMVAQAKAFRSDLVIGVHFNAGGGDGWEVLHQNTKESERLADAIGTEFNKINNPHGKNPTYVSPRNLGLMKSNMTTVITEGAYLDTVDVLEVQTLAGQHEYADAIFAGVCQYFGVKKEDNDMNQDEKSTQAKIEEETKKWKREAYTTALLELQRKGIIDGTSWTGAGRETEPAELWLVFTLLARIAKKLEV